MNVKRSFAALIAGTWVLPAYAADPAAMTASSTTTNATTIQASTVVSPGRYMASVLPAFNGEMAGRLEKAIRKVPGVRAVEARSSDTSIHFTIKDGAKVRFADLQKSVADADTGAVMSMPVLEHSMTPNPGL